jgi:hypothetical protein
LRKVTIVIALVLMAMLATACYGRAEGGEVSVVREGGPYDSREIKDVLCPGAQRKWIGVNSTEHHYPASGVQRYFKITSDPNEGADYEAVITAKSADGFNIHISGTMQFQTRFACTGPGEDLVKSFDRQFGVRKFPTPDGEKELAPWDGSDGWSAFLNAQTLPILQNVFRIAMLKFECQQIVASCSLVASRNAQEIDKTVAKQTGVNLLEIQKEIEGEFAKDLKEAWGQDYFTGFKFLMSQPTLDEGIENKINEGLGAFAIVSQARAQVQQAEQQANAARKVAGIYKNNPILAELEKWRIICGVSNGQSVQPGGGGQQNSQGGGCRNATFVMGNTPVIAGRR